MPKTSKKKSTADAVGLKYGFRSGLEEAVGAELEAKGIPYEYETLTIKFMKPAKQSRYTPDFTLKNGIIVETKGRFVTADRQKHLLIKQQHPELDIRFVFSNSKSRISKKSNTTYADWCIKNGFLYADKRIPADWCR